jgi:2-polyprenyl-6-hydroxyphenyl methylase/3-demethylubiquinone-9 3-methyltransferase
MNRSRILLRRALALYDDSPRGERLFVRARAFLSDLPQIERHAPREGAILDLGCGHGLVANLLAIGSPARDVTGIDIDAQKIEAAQRTVRARHNVRFLVADATTYDGGPYAAITVADVFYLIPPPLQRELLAACARMLAPGGMLIWKSQVRHPRWKYAITRGQEWLMTSLGPTQGHGLYFLDTDESLDALRAAGLLPVTITPRSWRPYTDVLFLAQKVG